MMLCPHTDRREGVYSQLAPVSIDDVSARLLVGKHAEIEGPQREGRSPSASAELSIAATKDSTTYQLSNNSRAQPLAADSACRHKAIAMTRAAGLHAIAIRRVSQARRDEKRMPKWAP
jgi:hypothetical protein